MHEIHLKYLRMSGELFDKRVESGEKLIAKGYRADEYTIMLQDRVLNNLPISKSDFEDINQFQDEKLFRLSQFFKRYSDSRKIKYYYIAKHLQAVSEIENLNLELTPWLLNTADMIMKWNDIGEKFISDNVSSFDETAETDAILSIRQKFILQQEEAISIIDPAFYNRYKNRIHYKA